MLRIVTDDDASAEMRGTLDEIVLDGAPRILAAALEAEVAVGAWSSATAARRRG